MKKADETALSLGDEKMEIKFVNGSILESIESEDNKRSHRAYKLKKCHCGGEVYLSPSKPWAQDPSIHCLSCGGSWSYGTYSDMLTVEKWNKIHSQISEEKR